MFLTLWDVLNHKISKEISIKVRLVGKNVNFHEACLKLRIFFKKTYFKNFKNECKFTDIRSDFFEITNHIHIISSMNDLIK